MCVIRTRCSEAKGTEARGFNLGCSVSRIIVDTKRWHASYYSHRGQQPYMAIWLVEVQGIRCMCVCVYIVAFSHFWQYGNIMFYGSGVDRNLFTRILYCIYIIYIYVYLCVFSLRIVRILVAYSNFGPRLYYLRI